MIQVCLLMCLVMGPRAKWSKRFLPNTINRVLFVVIVSVLILVGVVGGVENSDRGEGYFTLVMSILLAAGLYRFIAHWWLRGEISHKTDEPVATLGGS
jgi:hypothetical protein